MAEIGKEGPLLAAKISPGGGVILARVSKFLFVKASGGIQVINVYLMVAIPNYSLYIVRLENSVSS